MDFIAQGLGNDETLIAPKFNQVRLDDQMHNSPALAFAPDIIDTRHEFSECQGSLSAISFHVEHFNPENHAVPWGVPPTPFNTTDFLIRRRRRVP
jgi:hypothetical protein